MTAAPGGRLFGDLDDSMFEVIEEMVSAPSVHRLYGNADDGQRAIRRFMVSPILRAANRGGIAM